MDKILYKSLANVFRYPKKGYQENVNDCYQLLKVSYPDAASHFERFVEFVNERDLYQIEEVFGVTFHIQAVCYLDIGYVLFGEDYKRGEFLVQMKREQAEVGNDCGIELPDNLPNYLVLLTLIKDQELVNELAVRLLKVALEKMLIEFKASRMEIRNKVIKKKQKTIILEDIKEGNIFQNALQALLTVINQDFQGLSYHDEGLQPSLSNVIPNCGTCSTTEVIDKTKTVKL